MNPGFYIDLYCERTSPGFWNEPVNALSNVAFIIIAGAVWVYANKTSPGDLWQKLLILLAGSIGIGSFLFHTYATAWAEMADIIPIWSFVAAYVVLVIYRLTGQDIWKTVRIAGIAIVVSLICASFTSSELITDAPRPTPPLNGSLQYAPAVLALLFFTMASLIRKHPIRFHLCAATILFAAALTFRTIDHLSCQITQGVGTHFLWHALNGIMVGVLLHALVVHLPPVHKQ